MQTNQKSPRLFDDVSQQINLPKYLRDKQTFIAMYQTCLNAILALGELEHSGDWDPYLIIRTKQNANIPIETPNGYPELLIGDWNDDDNNAGTTIKHRDEITTIQIYIQLVDEEPNLETIKLSDILSIELAR